MVGGWEFDESFVYYQWLLSAKLNTVDCAWYLLEYKLEMGIITKPRNVYFNSFF